MAPAANERSAFCRVSRVPTWHGDGVLFALQRGAGHGRPTQARHVHAAHPELVEHVLLQVLRLQPVRQMGWD